MSAQLADRYLALEENPLEATPQAQQDQEAQDDQGSPSKDRLVPLKVDSLTRKQFQDLRKSGTMEDNYYLYPAVDQILRVTPAQALKPNRHYKLWVLKGMPSETGGLGTTSSKVINFETYYDFAWLGHPDPAGCVSLPSRQHHGSALTQLTFNFSNPVDPDSFLKHLSISPVPAGWGKAISGPAEADEFSDGDEGDEPDDTQDRRLYENRQPQQRAVLHSVQGLFLKIGTTYKFTVKAGLKDAFGNVLGKEESF